jgi:hypothetical protein
MDYSNTGSGSEGVFNQFTSNKYVNATSEFLSSNSLVAKVAFLLLVLFIFILLLRIGISLLGYIFSANRSPKLLNGMIDAKQLVVVPQNPKDANSVNIPRSMNENKGIEFTWSCWIHIDDLTYNSGKYRGIFYKGNDFSVNTNDNQGLNFPNNAPGLYIAPDTNNLEILMSTFNVINEKIIVTNIPLNKWVNVIIRCQNRTIDVYINGTIVKSQKLSGVPRQNFGNVYIAPNGGFSGYISNLWYYDYALSPLEISRLVSKGPNTNMISSASQAMKLKDPDYLSLRWFFFGSTDAYNP